MGLGDDISNVGWEIYSLPAGAQLPPLNRHLERNLQDLPFLRLPRWAPQMGGGNSRCVKHIFNFLSLHFCWSFAVGVGIQVGFFVLLES